MQVYRQHPHRATDFSKVSGFFRSALFLTTLLGLFSCFFCDPAHSDPLQGLKKTLNLGKRTVRFSLTVTEPPGPRQVKGTVTEVEGKIAFRGPGSFLLTLDFPVDRRGARIDISPKGGTLYNPQTKSTKPLPSGATGTALYGSPMSVSALNLISVFGDPKAVWSQQGARVLVKHPVYGTASLDLGKDGKLAGFTLQGKLPVRVTVLELGALGTLKGFPVLTKWQFLDGPREGTGVLELSE